MKNYILPNDISFGDKSELSEIADLIYIDGKYSKGGVPLFIEDNQMYVSTNDTHSLILGTTGSRKTRSVLLPMIFNIAGAEEKQSMIVHDTKGDVPKYTYEYLKEQGYDVYCLNFRNPNCSDHYNVLNSINELMQFDRKKAKRKLADISFQLFESCLENEKDPYWINMCSNYFVSLVEAMFVITEQNTKYMNFANAMSFHQLLNEQYVAKHFAKRFENIGEKNVAEGIRSIFENASDTKKNLLSMISNPFNTLESISEITYKSDFSAVDLATKPTCVFIITPDESNEYNFMVSLFVKQIYGELIDYASETDDTALPLTVNFIIDEFSSLPKIKSFNEMISAARSRNIRFHMVVQTLCQLMQTYNNSGASNIFNNCESIISMRSNDDELSKKLSNLVGKKTLQFSNTNVDLITPDTLRSLRKGEAISLLQGVKSPLKVYYPDISEYACYSLKKSDCLKRKRVNKIDIYKFENFCRDDSKEVNNLEENETKKYTDVEIVEKFIKIFNDREEQVLSYHKHKYPVMITEDFNKLSREKFDILIERVTYGLEKYMYKELLSITQASEKDVAVAVMALAERRDEILLRCQNKKQFDEAIDKLEKCGGLSYRRDDDSSSRPYGRSSKHLLDDIFI